ncbi:hypothetical protein OPV22_028568 [Ensete ventricosum]|uniref:C2 domain-containing protein n=1 Tax=Ensete ventricosum TaxID=4639 RepID=A0AAV8Q0S3_ENSVE|nr:hypothetical protein OPV22_028568 [Ensete ventricosum]
MQLLKLASHKAPVQINLSWHLLVGTQTRSPSQPETKRCKLDLWNQDVSVDPNSFLSVSNDHEKVLGSYIWCVY